MLPCKNGPHRAVPLLQCVRLSTPNPDTLSTYIPTRAPLLTPVPSGGGVPRAGRGPVFQACSTCQVAPWLPGKQTHACQASPAQGSSTKHSSVHVCRSVCAAAGGTTWPHLQPTFKPFQPPMHLSVLQHMLPSPHAPHPAPCTAGRTGTCHNTACRRNRRRPLTPLVWLSRLLLLHAPSHAPSHLCATPLPHLFTMPWLHSRYSPSQHQPTTAPSHSESCYVSAPWVTASLMHAHACWSTTTTLWHCSPQRRVCSHHCSSHPSPSCWRAQHSPASSGQFRNSTVGASLTTPDLVGTNTPRATVTGVVGVTPPTIHALQAPLAAHTLPGHCTQPLQQPLQVHD
jgi:hypothetical protein